MQAKPNCFLNGLQDAAGPRTRDCARRLNMSTEQTRKTMEHYVEALLSSGDFARYLASDVTFTIEGTDRKVQGRDAVRQTITFFHEQAFRTDIKVRNVMCDGNRAAIEAEFIGTHIGEFEGIKPTHRSVQLPYSVGYDVEGGAIKSLRLYFPMEALVRQLTLSKESVVRAS